MWLFWQIIALNIYNLVIIPIFKHYQAVNFLETCAEVFQTTLKTLCQILCNYFTKQLKT